MKQIFENCAEEQNTRNPSEVFDESVQLVFKRLFSPVETNILPSCCSVFEMVVVVLYICTIKLRVCVYLLRHRP